MWAAIGSGLVGMFFWFFQKRVEKKLYDDEIKEAAPGTEHLIERVAVSVSTIVYDGNYATVSLLSNGTITFLNITSTSKFKVIQISMVEKTFKVFLEEPSVRLLCEPFFSDKIGRSFTVDLIPPEYVSPSVVPFKDDEVVHLLPEKTFIHLRTVKPVKAIVLESPTLIPLDVSKLNRGIVGITITEESAVNFRALPLDGYAEPGERVVKLKVDAEKAYRRMLQDVVYRELPINLVIDTSLSSSLYNRVYYTGFPRIDELNTPANTWRTTVTGTSFSYHKAAISESYLKEIGFSGFDDPLLWLDIPQMGIFRLKRPVRAPVLAEPEDLTYVAGYPQKKGGTATFSCGIGQPSFEAVAAEWRWIQYTIGAVSPAPVNETPISPFVYSFSVAIPRTGGYTVSTVWGLFKGSSNPQIFKAEKVCHRISP